MVKTKVTDRIELYVPSRLNTIELQDVKYKEIDPGSPLAVFSDDYRTTDLSVNLTRMSLGNDLNILKEFYKSNLYALYDSVSMINDQIIEKNRTEFIRIEFIGLVLPQENAIQQNKKIGRYVIIQYTPFEEKMLIFSFMTPLENKNYWKEAAFNIMDNIKIK